MLSTEIVTDTVGARPLRSLLGGAVLGAAFQSALAVAYSARFAPVTFGGGKFAIVFFFTVLFGGVVGAFAGIAFAAWRGRDFGGVRRASFAASGLFWGLSGLIFYHAFRTSIRAQALNFLVSPLFGMIAVWGAVFLLFGIYATVRRAN